MRWGFAIAALCAVLWVACNDSEDHCATYAETCERWCEDEALEAFDRDTPIRLPVRRSPEDVLTLADGTTVSALPGSDGSGEQPDEATLERLRSLGYIEQ